MHLKYGLFLLLFFAGIHAYSQEKFLDTVNIPSVEVSTIFSIEKEQTSFKSLAIDSIKMSQKSSGSLADVLNEHSTIFVKSYGVGGLASVSFRGTSASHTMVLWNDIPINSSLNGQVDFSLIPLAFYDGIEINFGGASLEKNAGSLGGSINLSNITDYGNRFSIAVQQQFASFGNLSTSAVLKFGRKNFQSNTRIFRKSGENDFKYINLGKKGFPEERLRNAGVEQFGILKEFFLKPTTNSELSLQISTISTDREIPAIMLINNNKEAQKDDSQRATIGYKLDREVWQFKLKSSVFRDELSYTNELLRTENNTSFEGIKNLAQLNYELSEKSDFKVKLHADFDRATSPSYELDRNLNRQAIFFNYNYLIAKRVKVTAVVRGEAVTDQPSVVLPALGFIYRLGEEKHYLLRLNTSFNAKYPNLNDLYWQPGGNPDLKIERSKNLEIGVSNEYIYLADWMNWKFEATAFYMNISDYILWQPTAFGYWKSENLQEVVSQGGELNWSLRTKWRSWRNTTTFQYGYTSSVNQLSKQANDASRGKQLVYVPEHIANIFSQFNFKSWQLIYQMNYTSERFTATDNSDRLPFYLLHHFKLQKAFQLKTHHFSVAFQINNALDEDYQAIQWRPMPGRNYGININYNINK